MGNEEDNHYRKEGRVVDRSGPAIDRLVSVETQREFDLFTGEWAHRIFVKLYVAARTSGLLAAISDRDWKTLCTLATYMDGEGYCYPSQTELAAAMGCSRQMANERVRSLASFRFQDQPVLVIVKGERGAAGKWTGNGYRVLSLSSLRIYATEDARKETQIATNDSASDSRPQGDEAVSSALDTVMDSAAAVSSQTGTVALDTNKNHSLERDRTFEDRRTGRAAVSNFEGSHHQLKGTRGARRGSRRPAKDAEVTGAGVISRSGHNGDTNSAAGVSSLKELIVQRRQQSPIAPRRGRPAGTSDDRERLRAFLEDFARELGDEAPLSSTITRTLKIFKAAGVPPERWSDYLYQARGLTQEHTAQIRKLAAAGASGMQRKNKMPYFLATLEQLVGLRPEHIPAPPKARDISR